MSVGAGGLTVTWSAGTPGTLTLDVNGQTATVAIDLLCDAPTSAGSYTITSDALAAIPAGAANLNIAALSSVTATTMAGDWPITFVASTLVNDDALGNAWNVPLTLQ